MYRKCLHKFMKTCYKAGCNLRLSAWFTLPFSWRLLADVAMSQCACWYLQIICVTTCCIQLEMEFTTASATTTAIAMATVTATPTIWYIGALHFPHIHIPNTAMVTFVDKTLWNILRTMHTICDWGCFISGCNGQIVPNHKELFLWHGDKYANVMMTIGK